MGNPIKENATKVIALFILCDNSNSLFVGTGSLKKSDVHFVQQDNCDWCYTTLLIALWVQETPHKLSQHNHISQREICPRVNPQLDQF